MDASAGMLPSAATPQEIFLFCVFPFLPFDALFRRALVSKGWRDGVDAEARRALRALVRETRFPHPRGRHAALLGAGADLFEAPLDAAAVAAWAAARGARLPSHARVLLTTVGGARFVGASGYVGTAANTYRRLADWRSFDDMTDLAGKMAAAGFGSPAAVFNLTQAYPLRDGRRGEQPEPWVRAYFPIAPCLVVRYWRVPFRGEAYDIEQAVRRRRARAGST